MLFGLERTAYTVTDASFVEGVPAAWQDGLAPSGCLEGRELVKATGQSSASLEEGQQHLNSAEVKPGFIKL